MLAFYNTFYLQYKVMKDKNENMHIKRKRERME